MARKPIDTIEHSAESRPNNPPAGLAAEVPVPKVTTRRTEFDPNRDPQLQWAGKKARGVLEVSVVPLHVHELVEPHTIIDHLRGVGEDDPQQSIFFSAIERPRHEAIDFYKHQDRWSNRLVAGDSALVMTSLLEKEGLGGRVQMIYFDPPYGIEYKSNFQPFVNKRDVTDRQDKSLTHEPEMLTAFRDTWELGIHSYLTYMRDRLCLARELLHETGSIFVQISDENVHRVRILMDEIFGSNCFICTIVVKKKGYQKSSLMDPVNDYIVWFAKSPRKSGRVKINKLYFQREIDTETLSEFRFIELPDGTEMPVSRAKRPDGTTIDYRRDPRKLTTDYRTARLYRANPLTSGGEFTNQTLPFTFKGKTYHPGANKCWKTSARPVDGTDLSGMDRLALAGRLIAQETQLRYRNYLDDFGCVELSNWWDGLGGASDPVYVVQTNVEIVRRCMLMTSDPGDLVFDPTCGSGTTAFVAEHWGRRWITCDTSRVAISLARQRMITATFPSFKVKDATKGVSGGFEYKTVNHITLTMIANNPAIRHGVTAKQIADAIDRHAEKIELIDQPVEREGDRVRVTGPFTVEAVPAPLVLAPEDVTGEELDGPILETPVEADTSLVRSGASAQFNRWRNELLATGIRMRGANNVLKFTKIDPMPGTTWVQGEGTSKNKLPVLNARQDPHKVFIVFGPDHAPITTEEVNQALNETVAAARTGNSPALLAFCAFQFDAEAARILDEWKTESHGFAVLKVQMNTDLLTEDLKTKRSSNESFWMIGQPDIQLQKVGALYQVRVKGFDYYNTLTGEIDSGGPDTIAMWMLDTNFNGRSLYPKQVFFPLAADDEGWSRLARTLRSELEEDRIEAFRGTASLPFKGGKYNRVAVKIIDVRGIESLRVLSLEKGSIKR
jgi:adenine-specific DNA-methyltransferase